MKPAASDQKESKQRQVKLADNIRGNVKLARCHLKLAKQKTTHNTQQIDRATDNLSVQQKAAPNKRKQNTMLKLSSLKTLETENFKLVTVDGKTSIKATTAMAKAYLKLKKLANPVACDVEMANDAIAKLVDLEASVTKLAAI